jgi:hypothetical protein
LAQFCTQVLSQHDALDTVIDINGYHSNASRYQIIERVAYKYRETNRIASIKGYNNN